MSVMLISLFTRAILEVLSFSTRYFHLLFPGLPYPSTAMSCGSIVSFFPFVKGLQSYWRGYFVIAKQYPGKYSTYLLLSLYCDEEGIGGLSSLLSERLSLVAAFTLNYIEEENK